MAYDTFNEFRNALTEAGYQPPRDGLYEGMFGYRRLFAYYRLALQQDSLTIGKIEHLEGRLAEDGSAADRLSGKLFLIGKEATQWWSIWANDSYILGGIHGHRPFDLVTSAEDPNELDRLDPSAGRFVFKVTQRELIGITQFGYTPSSRAPSRFECTSQPLADAASFEWYKDLVDQMTNALRPHG